MEIEEGEGAGRKRMQAKGRAHERNRIMSMEVFLKGWSVLGWWWSSEGTIPWRGIAEKGVAPPAGRVGQTS